MYLLKMSWTSTVSSMDLTRVHRERLMAAGNSEMRVCGVLDSLYTYNGKTKIMHGLVTPDLSGEIIVSRFDAASCLIAFSHTAKGSYRSISDRRSVGSSANFKWAVHEVSAYL